MASKENNRTTTGTMIKFPIEIDESGCCGGLSPTTENQLDQLWTDVDMYMMTHLHSAMSEPTAELLSKILRSSEEHGLPMMSVSSAQGKYLQQQIRMLGARHVIEVGTLGGYSTVWMAKAHQDVSVTTIEISDDYASLAAKHFQWAGVERQIDVQIGSGLEVLPELMKEVDTGIRPRIDLAFIDANKADNLEYFTLCAKMGHPGTVIIVDNVVRGGAVLQSSAKSDASVQGTRKLIEALATTDGVDSVVVQTVGEKGYDGFLVSLLTESYFETTKSMKG